MPQALMLKSWSWTILWRPTRPSRTNTKNRCPFHHRGLKCRKLRDTWSNGQVWPWSTKWSRAEANRVLPRECTGHSNTLFPKRLPRDDSTHGYHQMVNTEIKLIVFFAGKDGEALYSQQKQDCELTWLRSSAPYCKIQAQNEKSRENH